MRPTNCGYIPDGSRDYPIHGPLEAVLPPHGIPMGYALAHIRIVYRLIGGTADTLPTHQYMWPVPYSNKHYVRVVMETTYYSLVVEYAYAPGTGYYTCYAVVEKTWTIIAVHYIYGVGNLLSIVQMVKDYCSIHAPGYAQCRTCRYASSEARYSWCNSWYCGHGLEIDTGTCSSWVAAMFGE